MSRIVPGRASADPDQSYAPMQKRPLRLECGEPMHYAYGGGLSPCCLVGWLLHESRMEVNELLHTRPIPGQRGSPVPIRVEPLPPPAEMVDGRYVPATEGRGLMVTDSGPLGGPSWSGKMHHRMDIQYFAGETSQATDPSRPLDKAMAGLRRYCSGKHSEWPEHRGEPVCWSLIRLIVMGRYSVEQAAFHVELTPGRAVWLLHRPGDRSWIGAADKLWTWVANDLNDLSTPRRKVA